MSIVFLFVQGFLVESGGSIDIVVIVQVDLKNGFGGFWSDVFCWFCCNFMVWIGVVIVLLFLFVVVFVFFFVLYLEMVLFGVKYIMLMYIFGFGELLEFFFGFDWFGGDVLFKFIWGVQVFLLIGVIFIVMGFVGGMILGLFVGIFGGWVDMVIMCVVDIIFLVLNLLFVVLIVVIFGQMLFVVMIVIGVLQVLIFVCLL